MYFVWKNTLKIIYVSSKYLLFEIWKEDDRQKEIFFCLYPLYICIICYVLPLLLMSNIVLKRLNL